MTADPRDLHTPLTGEHCNLAFDLADQISSFAISAREAFYRGSFPLALHHVGQARTAMVGLIPLAKRLSEHALTGGEVANA